MSFVTKDGFWIECENEHEFIVPPRCRHSELNVIDVWSRMTSEELSKIVNEALEKHCLTIKKTLEGCDLKNE